MRADTRKYAQTHVNTRKYEQVHANTVNTCRYMQIRPNTRRYTQMLYNRVTSAARERAQRAQRAKCRKETASSYAQLQGAPFSSVRRHVPASLIMITRFPFTYQTGYVRFFGQFMWPWVSQDDVFTLEKQLFSWICMF